MLNCELLVRIYHCRRKNEQVSKYGVLFYFLSINMFMPYPSINIILSFKFSFVFIRMVVVVKVVLFSQDCEKLIILPVGICFLPCLPKGQHVGEGTKIRQFWIIINFCECSKFYKTISFIYYNT